MFRFLIFLSFLPFCSPSSLWSQVEGLEEEEQEPIKEYANKRTESSTYIYLGSMIATGILLFMLLFTHQRKKKNLETPPFSRLDKSYWEGLIQHVQKEPAPHLGSQKEVNKLYTILTEGASFAPDKINYSYSIASTQRRMGYVGKDMELIQTCWALVKQKGDPVNIFLFEKTLYIGLESRSIAYNRDIEKGGVNPIYNRLTEAQRKKKPTFTLQITSSV